MEPAVESQLSDQEKLRGFLVKTLLKNLEIHQISPTLCIKFVQLSKLLMKHYILETSPWENPQKRSEQKSAGSKYHLKSTCFYLP